MRQRLLFLALALTAAAAVSLPAPRAEASGGYSCLQCVTYSDGSQCCVNCWCDSSGSPMTCAQNACDSPFDV
jgi:hypothetical protein